MWSDAFDRPDADAIGNDWIEKRPTTWAIAGARVVAEGDPLNYEDNIVYRPEEEDLLDLSVSIEFLVLAADENNHAQVHLRLQHEDLEEPLSVTGYILYVNDPYLSITRQIAGAFDDQWNAELTRPVVPGERYRLTFSAVGEDPVQLLGLLEIETDAGWETHTEVSHDDTDPDRIATPGTMGFSGADEDQNANIVYDNFTRLDL